jgi:hypothetical protein
MKNKTKIKYSIAIILFQMQTLFAQTLGFDDDVQDVVIDIWIVPLMLLGIGMILFAINKKSQVDIRENNYLE